MLVRDVKERGGAWSTVLAPFCECCVVHLRRTFSDSLAGKEEDRRPCMCYNEEAAFLRGLAFA